MGLGKKLTGLFITDDENSEQTTEETQVTSESTDSKVTFPKENKKTTPISFPKEDEDPFKISTTPSNDEIEIEETPSPTAAFITPTDNTNPQLAAVIRSYETGFDNMNIEGVDFYEFYKSVIIDDQIDNLPLYPMAFKMMQGLNPNFTKDSAIANANFYLTNLESAHSKLKEKGELKKNGLLTEKSQEESALAGEVQTLEQQLKQIETQLKAKRVELSNIDGKYTSALNDVELTLKANDTAKNALVNSIKKVVTNITKTIK